MIWFTFVAGVLVFYGIVGIYFIRKTELAEKRRHGMPQSERPETYDGDESGWTVQLDSKASGVEALKLAESDRVQAKERKPRQDFGARGLGQQLRFVKSVSKSDRPYSIFTDRTGKVLSPMDLSDHGDAVLLWDQLRKEQELGEVDVGQEGQEQAGIWDMVK